MHKTNSPPGHSAVKRAATTRHRPYGSNPKHQLVHARFQPRGGGGGAKGSDVREGVNAERRGEAEPSGDPEAARREVLPSERWGWGRQGRLAEFRGRGRQVLALPLLLLEQ